MTQRNENFYNLLKKGITWTGLNGNNNLLNST